MWWSAADTWETVPVNYLMCITLCGGHPHMCHLLILTIMSQKKTTPRITRLVFCRLFLSSLCSFYAFPIYSISPAVANTICWGKTPYCDKPQSSPLHFSANWPLSSTTAPGSCIYIQQQPINKHGWVNGIDREYFSAVTRFSVRLLQTPTAEEIWSTDWRKPRGAVHFTSSISGLLF